jgi:hypothetical protein
MRVHTVDKKSLVELEQWFVIRVERFIVPNAPLAANALVVRGLIILGHTMYIKNKNTEE